MLSGLKTVRKSDKMLIKLAFQTLFPDSITYFQYSGLFSAESYKNLAFDNFFYLLCLLFSWIFKFLTR